MIDPSTIIKSWCAACGMPEPSNGECEALHVALTVQPVASTEPIGYIMQTTFDWITAPKRGRSAATNTYIYKSGAYEARVPIFAAPVAAASAEPVAVVGEQFGLFWVGSGPIAPLIERHGIKVGTKLYAAPVAAQAQPDAEEDAYVIDRLSKMLAEIAVIVRGPELAGHRHGYADLPERVAALKAVAAQAQPVVNQSLTTESDREAMADAFETWWSAHGQHCRAGGGDYEKTFAYRAYEHAYDEGFRAALAPLPYKDSTPQLHVGDSSFEGWYGGYTKDASGGLKQLMRDAYAAGMGDPLVAALAQQPSAQDRDVFKSLPFVLQVYDDALDKAREGRHFDNPCKAGTLEYRAWELGTKRGKELGPITDARDMCLCEEALDAEIKHSRKLQAQIDSLVENRTAESAALTQQSSAQGVAAGEKVISKPGAVITVRELELTEAGKRAITTGIDGPLPGPDCAQDRGDAAKCWCEACRPLTMTNCRMIVCPDCGDKRCPRAHDHRNACAPRAAAKEE